MTVESLVFSDESIEVPVTIGNRQYTLVEATGDAATKNKNAIAKGTKFINGKVSSIDTINDSEALLISMCLFDDKGSRVPEAVVRGFRSSIMTKLYETCKKISGLNDVEDGKKAKCDHDNCKTNFCPICGTGIETKDSEGNDLDSSEDGSS